MRISNWSSDVCPSDLDHGAVSGVARGRADGRERYEHQRLFQALALVQGDHLHAVRVGLQPQQLALVVGVGVGDGVAQPVDQAVQAERARLRVLQQFGQLQIIGEAALAVEQAEQAAGVRSEEHTSELQSLMRISYADFCLKKKK